MKLAFLVVVAVTQEASLVERIRAAMYDAANHRYIKIWSPERIGIVPIVGVPGKTVWINPMLSLPALGSGGTSPRLSALGRLFGIKIAHNGPSDGTAIYPTYVGRSVNPNSNALTVVGPDGRPVPDLVIKGVGSTHNRIEGFNLPLTDALLDADITTNLMREGVRVYRPLLIFVPEEAPDMAVYVRAPDSMLRHKDPGLLSDAELKATLTVVAGDARMSVDAWAQDFLPRETGRNAGILAALGVAHDSPHGTDNHGLYPETVDWDRFSIDRAAAANQKIAFWKPVSATLDRINKALPPSQQVDVEKARANFDKGYEEGLQHRGRIVLHEGSLEGLPTAEIQKLFSGEADLPDGRDALLRELKARGLVKGGNIEGWATDVTGQRKLGANDGSPMDRVIQSVRTTVVRQMGGVATYAVAFALEGVIKAVVERDPEALMEHLRQMTTPGFWGTALLFGVASQATETAVTYGASRVPAVVVQAVPKTVIGAGKLVLGGLGMAGGMAVVQYATTGRISLKDLAITTGSFMVTGAAVNLVVDGVIFLLSGSTPVGWLYIGAKLALTLYFGEELDRWIRLWWEGASRRAAAWLAGVKPKIDAILERR